ncbi:MAG TPA: hypothetical protein VGE57_05010 [Solimonas sp.]
MIPTGKFDSAEAGVIPVSALPLTALSALLSPYGLQLQTVADGQPIPGSYWGEREAGLIGDVLYLRADTPVHSALHEASHYLCMDAARRAALHTDAHPTGDDIEENATCYLQCLLADRLAGYSRAQCFRDMDAWGYHFLLGSTQAWFEHDAEDARGYLLRHALIDEQDRLSGRRRED